MPVIRPLQSQQGLGGTPQASVQIDNSIGESLQGLGRSLENAASVRLEMQNREAKMLAQNEEFRADQQFEQFKESLGVDYQTAKGKLDPSGQGLTDGFVKKYDEKAGQFLQSVPAQLQPKFKELSATARAAWLDKAAQEEATQRQSWFRTGIKDKTDKLTTQVFENPQVFGDAYEDGLRTIRASGLPEVERPSLKRRGSSL